MGTLRWLGLVQARLVQLMQKLSPDHFDWATSIVLGRYPGAVQVRIIHTHQQAPAFSLRKDAASTDICGVSAWSYKPSLQCDTLFLPCCQDHSEAYMRLVHDFPHKSVCSTPCCAQLQRLQRGLCRVLVRSWGWILARWTHSRCASCSTMCTPVSVLARGLCRGLTAS